MGELQQIGDDLVTVLASIRRAPDAVAPASVELPTVWTEVHMETFAGVMKAEARARAGFLPCGLCRDMGFTFAPNDRGFDVATPCRCAGLRARIDAFNRAGLPAEHHGASLRPPREVGPGGFDWKGRPKVAEAIGAFIEAKGECRGVMLYGENGTGKSHLISAVARRLTLRDAISVRYVLWPALVDEVHNALAQKKSVQHVTEPYSRAGVLIVDELGAGGGASEFHASIVEALIGRRLERGADGSRILVATNLQVEGTPGDPLVLASKVGGRIMSRLRGGCEIFDMAGEDYRRRRSA